MSEEEYNEKLEALQQYIPFLDNMIAQLKDPNKKNREQQLSKMESLHAMITDKKRRLKLETLNKCEDVISKLYYKVNHKTLRIRKNSASPVLSSPASSRSVSITPNRPCTPKTEVQSPFREAFGKKSPRGPEKPPISLEDLKTLEHDVHEKITKNASLRELDKLRNKIAFELLMEDSKSLSANVNLFTGLSSGANTTMMKNPSPPITPGQPELQTSLYSDTDLNSAADGSVKSPNAFSDPPEEAQVASQTPIKEIKSPTSDVPQDPIPEPSTKMNVDETPEPVKSSPVPEREPNKLTDNQMEPKDAPGELKFAPVTLDLSENGSSSTERPVGQSPEVASSVKKESESEKLESDKKFGSIITYIDKQIHEARKKTEEQTKSLIDNLSNVKAREKSKSDDTHKERRPSTSQDRKTDSSKKDESDKHKEQRRSDKSDGTHKSNKSDRPHKSDSSDKDKKSRSEDKHNKDSKSKDDRHKSSDRKDKDSKDRHSSKTKSPDKKVTEESYKCDKDKINHKPQEHKSSKINVSVGQVQPTGEMRPSGDHHKVGNFANNTNRNKGIQALKRLADKYNPKPRKAAVEPDVDKTISEIIEANMKMASPPNIPLLTQIPAPIPPSASLVACAHAEPDLPSSLKTILTPSTTQLINNVVSQLRHNNTEAEHLKRPSRPLSPPSLENASMPVSPLDDFVSEYARNPELRPPHMQRPHEPTKSQFIPPLGSHDSIKTHFLSPISPQEPLRNQFIPPSNSQDQIRNQFVPVSPQESIRNQFIPPSSPVCSFQPPPSPVPMFDHPTQHSFKHQPQHNMFNQHAMENMHQLDYYPPNAPIPSNQYAGGPPLLSPEMPHFIQEHKPNSFGMFNRDVFSYEDAWRMENSRHRGGFDNRYRGPSTYREYREMKENSRDPRVSRPESRGPRDNRAPRDRDPRENRDPRERDPREIRDPRERRDPRDRPDKDLPNSKDSREIRDPRLRRDSRDSETKDPRVKRDLDKSRDRSEPKDESKFDRLYARTNRDLSQPDPKDSKESFVSPLDSLYTVKEERKTGKGYGVQPFRIPKVRKEEADKGKKEGSTEVQADSELPKLDRGDKFEVKEKESYADGEHNEISENHDDNDSSENEDIFKIKVETVEKDTPVSEKDSSVVDGNANSENEKPSDKEEPQTSKTIAETHPEPTEKSKSETESEPPKAPAEQTILAQFFANLLHSQNKRDKKTALYSLINTFSDSFSSKELTKITKIIKASDDESSGDDEDESKKDDADNEEASNAVAQPEPVISQTEDDDAEDEIKVTKHKPTRRIRRISSASPVKEDKKAPEENEGDPPESLEKVVVTVGERIKSRKRQPAPKHYKKRTELDMLHEDIKDMFIRDGVLTATGKRMCRLLKSDPSVLTTSTSEEIPSEDAIPEEPVKLRKKPGPKPKVPAVDDPNTMKSVRVVIPKMSESSFEESVKTTRRLTRSMMTDIVDEKSVQEDNGSCGGVSDVDSGSDTEKDTSSQTSESAPAVRVPVKRKRGRRWASGIIDGKKKKKEKLVNEQPTMEVENDTLPQHDKNYFLSHATQKLKCWLCDFEAKFITTHYKHAHPDSEVLTSRFSQETAEEAFRDSAENLEKYESLVQKKGSCKIKFICRFCSFKTHVFPTIFYDHLSSHTGEYRHICPICNFSACSGKTLKVHLTSSHNYSKVVKRKQYSDTIQFAYVCGECNYVQMDKSAVERHVGVYHSSQAPIHKVNMSTFCDPEIEKLNKSEAQIAESTSTSSLEVEQELAEAEKPVEDSEKTQESSNSTVDESDIRESSNKEAAPPSMKGKKRGPKPGPKPRKRMIEIEKSAAQNQEESGISEPEKVSDTPVEEESSTPPVKQRKRRFTLSLDDVPLVRGKRAAKEKAQEKLKSLADANESFVRKKSAPNEEDSKTDEKEAPAAEVTDASEENLAKDDSKPEKKEESPKPAKKVKQEIDMNVFTCNTDIQEENKKIELERLQKMDELNKTVGARTSLNFVDKLCTRLNQNELIVKQEPEDHTEHLVPRVLNDSPLTMPVLEKNPPLAEQPPPVVFSEPLPPKKPVLPSEETQIPTTSFEVTLKNDKSIKDMIEKLKGKLATNTPENDPAGSSDVTVISDDGDSEGPPPLTHVNEIVNIKALDGSAETLLLGGLIKVIKTKESTMYCCLVPPCALSTDKMETFQWHCKMAHRPKSIGRFSTLCETCGLEVKSSLDGNLLENLFKHAVSQHKEFLEGGTSTEAGPSTARQTPTLRIRKLSGDALSLKKDWDDEIEEQVIPKDLGEGSRVQENNKENENSPAGPSNENSQENVLEQEVVEDNNPFPFKIAGVMSLAESHPELPPLTPIAKQTLQSQTSPQLVVKEAKLTAAELANPKKTQKAMTKFIESVSDLYKCPSYYCLFTTNFRDFLERHLKAHKIDHDVMVPCVYCDLKTPWEHVPMHIDVRHAHCRFACNYCLYRAIAKEYVFLHQDQEHRLKDYSVIALPLPKGTRKFAVAEQKIDPKTLCEPYNCAHFCNARFLFVNEFRRHLRLIHKFNSFMMCGYKDCSSRITTEKLPQHWAQAHNVAMYQCGCCKISSNELRTMYYHFSQFHQGQMVDILVRLLQPLKDSITYGYSPEAFKRLRKIATLPIFNGENKLDSNQTSDTFPVTVPASLPPKPTTLSVGKTMSVVPVTSVATLTGGQVLVPTSSIPFSLVTTPTTNTMKNILLVTSDSGTTTANAVEVEMNPAQVVASAASNAEIVKVVPSVALVAPATPKTDSIPTAENEPLVSPPKDSAVAPVEQILLGEEIQQVVQEETPDSEVDPLYLGDNEGGSHVFSSGDESDASKTEKTSKKSGLLGYQLYRCAFCNFSCSNSNDFKKHVTKSVQCKSTDLGAKLFVCVHCRKKFKNPYILVEHIQCHGILRFTCSLCEDKFPTTLQAKNHFKVRHSVNQITLTPLNASKGNLDVDEYTVRPKLVMSAQPAKEMPPVELSPATSPMENLFMPEDIGRIPIRSIFSHDIKCGICSYATKVRTNLVRHLQFHSEEKSVPDTAPVNPVPCLEKNEKMFDKMINLASSSHSGRMGGNKDNKDREPENLPDFVPSYSRYACCAQGCQYICPEEANLRHHLMALHDGDASFTCLHCKADLAPTDADNLLKHFKLHGLQLYKCNHCAFMHHLKHKVEKHITDGHLDLPVKVVTVRHLESEPPSEQATGATGSAPSTTPLPKTHKPWRCCMCKTRSHTQEGIQTHVLEKHEIDSQFKCALCSYKTNDIDTFNDHFKNAHVDKEIDIIHVYRKIEDGPKETKEDETFDTTPLWQRDRPRVRHIRGILFEEVTPVKSPKKAPKNAGGSTTPAAATTKSSASATSPEVQKHTHNLDMAIESVVNGTADILKQKTPEKGDGVNSEVNRPTNESTKSSDSDEIIIIDDEDEKEIQAGRGVKRKSSPEVQGVTKISKMDATVIDLESSNSDNDSSYDFDENDLATRFGEYGLPLNRQLKCPKCNKFKSKRMSDFIFHVYKEMKVYRFKCGICSDESITYRYMYSHVKEHKRNQKPSENIIALPTDPKLEIWLQILIQRQSSIIINYVTAPPEALIDKDKVALCHYCQKWYRSEMERNEHSLHHWSIVPFGCNACPFVGFSAYQVKKHYKLNHLDWPADVIKRSITVSKELKNADNLHMKEVQNEVGSVLRTAYASPAKNDKKEVEVPTLAIPEVPVLDEAHVSPNSDQDMFHNDILDKTDLLEMFGNGQDDLMETLETVHLENDESDLVIVDEANENDLLLVTRTETKDVPNEADVYCCEYCPSMSNSEMSIMSHITAQHDNMHIKFRVLNKIQCQQKKQEYVGCMLCSETGSEIKIRQHHLDMHNGLTFNMYRYICEYCTKRFLKLGGLKRHAHCTHPGSPLKYTGLPTAPKGRQKTKDPHKDKYPENAILRCYRCTVCPSYERNFPTSLFHNVRAHIRTHFKAFVCGHCNVRCRSKFEASSHGAKEHVDRPENIMFDNEIEEQFQKVVCEVQEQAALIEKQVLEVKSTARKSTSGLNKPQEEYSYYGLPVEEIDLTKIMTSVEVNGMCLNMSADRLGKIFDLLPNVHVQDCGQSAGLSDTADILDF